MEEFEREFVVDFDQSVTRRPIFQTFLEVLSEISEVLRSDLRIWVDGSYVSRKVEPADIDFVLFVPVVDLNQLFASPIFKLLETFDGHPWIDGYMLPLFPVESEGYSRFTQSDMAYWQNYFSLTKLNRGKKQFPKGFVEIKMYLKQENDGE